MHVIMLLPFMYYNKHSNGQGKQLEREKDMKGRETTYPKLKFSIKRGPINMPWQAAQH